jgi:hypothetical protein
MNEFSTCSLIGSLKPIAAGLALTFASTGKKRLPHERQTRLRTAGQCLAKKSRIPYGLGLKQILDAPFLPGYNNLSGV